MGQRLIRAKARRGKFNYVDRQVEIPDLPEGMLDLGLASGGREVLIDLFDLHPHLLVAGATRQGKTKRIRAWCLQALLRWGWEVEVIDFKGGGDYWPVLTNGGVLHATAETGKAALKRVAEDVRTRNALMLNLSIPYVDPEGFWRDGRATTFREIPLHLREEHELKPRLLIVDEAADIAALQGEFKGKNQPRGPGGMQYLREGTQKGASAGVHVIVAIHQPRAELFEGFIKQNMPARVLFGKATPETEKMMFEDLITDHPERSLPRSSGTGFACEVGGYQLVRFRSPLLEPYRYDPLLADPPSSDDPVAPGALGPSDPPGPSAPDPSGSDPLAGTSSASSADPSFGGVEGGPYGPPSEGAASSSSSVLARVVLAVRPVATGPFVRTYLRAHALRLLVGRRVAGPFVRDPFKIVEVRDKAGDRCSACGRTGNVDIDHTRPLWAGGRDVVSNMRPLCMRASKPSCHGAKTAAEGWVRRVRDREIQRGIPGRIASSWWTLALRMPLWLWVGIVTFVLGLVFSGYWWIAGLGLFATTLLPPLARHFLVPKFLRRQRGPGLDGRGTWDDERELQRYDGYLKFLVGRSQGGRNGVVGFRYGLMGLSAVFLLGALPALIL